MKIYISGPITGRDKKEYLEHFQKAEDFIRKNGWFPVNPAKMQAFLPEEETTHDEYMVVSLAELSICDGIYMLKGWKKSKGAKREMETALLNGKFIIHEDGPAVYCGTGSMEEGKSDS